MKKTALSVDMRNTIVWLERQPGVTSVVQGRYNGTRHHHEPGFARVVRADSKHVVLHVYDKNGMKDLYVNAEPSPVRDKWVAAVASGKPFTSNGDGPAIASLKQAIHSVTSAVTSAVRDVLRPEAAIDNAAQVYDVTPELAARWLEHNTRNRKLRQSAINRYAADMRNGRWYVSPDAIAFDKNGAIVNGQHRLWAVLEAGVTVQMLVMFNVEPEVIVVLDNPLVRTTADAASIRKPGTSVSHIHTSVSNMMLATSIMATAVDRRQALGRITRQQQLDTLERHWDAVEFAFRECFRSASMRSITVAGVLTPVARAFYTQDKDRLRHFGKVMLSGLQDTNGDQPAILLRNYLLRFGAGVKPTPDVVYRKTERALAAFLESTKLAMLYEASTELFPLPEDQRPKGR